MREKKDFKTRHKTTQSCRMWHNSEYSNNSRERASVENQTPHCFLLLSVVKCHIVGGAEPSGPLSLTAAACEDLACQQPSRTEAARCLLPHKEARNTQPKSPLGPRTADPLVSGGKPRTRHSAHKKRRQERKKKTLKVLTRGFQTTAPQNKPETRGGGYLADLVERLLAVAPRVLEVLVRRKRAVDVPCDDTLLRRVLREKKKFLFN